MGFRPNQMSTSEHDRAQLLLRVAPKVLLVGRSLLICAGLERILIRRGRGVVRVVGRALNLDHARQVFAVCPPEVVLIGAGNINDDQVHLVQALRSLGPRVGVVVVTVDDDEERCAALRRSGATSVLRDDASPLTLIRSLMTAVRGPAGCPDQNGSTAAEAAVESFLAGARQRLELLSPREMEVVSALALGLSNDHVSRRLGVTVSTVKAHLRQIFRKLDVSNRTGAARVYLEAHADRTD